MPGHGPVSKTSLEAFDSLTPCQQKAGAKVLAFCCLGTSKNARSIIPESPERSGGNYTKVSTYNTVVLTTYSLTPCQTGKDATKRLFWYSAHMSEHLRENDLGKETEVKQEMTAEDVAGFYNELEKLGVQVWIDGGWGVDALLGESTRVHSDLDIIVQKKDVGTIRSLLESRGYKVVPRDDLSDLNFHLRDDHGHEIDFTVIEFDDAGNGIYGPVENGEMNPADSFKGEGTINGQSVRCVSPAYAVQFRTGYELRDIDRQDVTALCDKFGLPLPEEYSESADE